VHGARIVSEVVGNEQMFEEWKGEMEMMAGRIKVGTALEYAVGHGSTAFCSRCSARPRDVQQLISRDALPPAP